MISKKYIIIICIIALTAFAAIGGLLLFRSYKNVTFVIDYPGATGTIDGSNSVIQNRSSVWLKKQDYQVSFTNKELDSSPIDFTVSDNTNTVSLSPNLSRTELAKRLSSERPTIQDKIKNTFKTPAQYSLQQERLYHKGDWYSASIQIFQLSSSDPDIGNPGDVSTYYLILKKTDSRWDIVANPSLILTKPDNPSIPSDILDSLNPTQ